MESNTSSKKIVVNATNDRIGSLSDELAIHILSFLPTKDAVATSILAKRWRYLWTHITNLLFDCSPKTDDESFHDFVDGALHRCTMKQIKRFYLHTYKAKLGRVKEWVNEAVRRNVYELELSLQKFPSFMSTCETLTILKISFKRVSDFQKATSFYLPNLLILSLEFPCPSNILSKKLFQSCPALQDLDIRATRGYLDNLNFTIIAPVLKRLRFFFDVKIPPNCKFVIEAPNLEYMNMYNGQILDYEVRNLSSVSEALVAVGDKYYTLDVETIANRAVELLRGLCGVKSLSLRAYTMRALDHAHPHHLPVFYNLIRLELGLFVNEGRKILLHLLGMFPNLKVLIVLMGRSHRVGPFSFEYAFAASDWSEPHHLPACLSSCLEIVQIGEFLGNEYELKLVEYLLKNAACLEKLTVHPVGISREAKVQFCEKMSEFPRKSKTCQVHLS